MLTDPRDAALFESAYQRFNFGASPAQLVIYLRATPELALQRVRARYEDDIHRHFERAMELERLQGVDRQYEQYRDRLGETLHTIDLIDVLDPADSQEESKQRVLEGALELL
jgi:thymidylate kinase